MKIMSKNFKEPSSAAFSYIQNLYAQHDPVVATKMVDQCYGENMMSRRNIESDQLRIKLWQVSHSILYIEEKLGINLEHVEEVKIIAEEVQYTEPLRTCAKHLISAIDSLVKHLDN